MATVRFSSDLKQQILNNASATMLPAIQRAEVQRPSHDWGLRIYETIFRNELHALKQVPDHWFTKVSELKVARVNGAYCAMAFQLPTSMPWPAVFPDTVVARRLSSYLSDIEVNHELFEDLKDELLQRNAAISEAKKRQAEFRNMVEQVIDSYATLAPALKAWPPLWDLIPDPVKDRHREVKERVAKTVDLAVDLGKLTAMSAAAKFGV